jgi:cytoskeletal protein RodZ
MRMESDEFDFLAPAYVRGFLKTYARYLGITPEPLLADFDRRYGTGDTETASLAALERRSRDHGPKERARLNSWGVAAAVAGAALLLLMVIGLVSNPQRPAPQTIGQGSHEARAPGATPSPSPSSTPSAAPTPTLALAQGIDLKIIASRERCWVQVNADGSTTPAYSGVLELGQSHSFSAQKYMTVVLGNARGVDLVVNGKNIGSPGGIVRTLRIPQDVKTLL